MSPSGVDRGAVITKCLGVVNRTTVPKPGIPADCVRDNPVFSFQGQFGVLHGGHCHRCVFAPCSIGCSLSTA